MAGPAFKSSKPGRNAPCWCGSGKKYKVCHLPSDETERTEQRKLEQAQDTLLPKLIEAAQGVPEVFPQALEQFWGGHYSLNQMGELDDLEDQGAERFLTWLAFNYTLDDGHTLVEKLAHLTDQGSLDVDSHEMQLLRAWEPVRLQPYLVEGVVKGQSITLRNMLEHDIYAVSDHAASRRVEVSEVLVGHIVPVGTQHMITGAVAHLTADTAEKLVEFASLYLEDLRRTEPDATWQDLLRSRSYILNQFVMALPREEANPTLLDKFVLQTRVALQLTGQSLAGLVGKDSESDEMPKDETY